MSRRTEWLLKALFLALGILSLALPVLVVKIGGNTFTKTQTTFFLTASLLSFQALCFTQILADRTRKKKLNAFCLCTSILLTVVLIGLWV